jgi:hypothetical protein
MPQCSRFVFLRRDLRHKADYYANPAFNPTPVKAGRFAAEFGGGAG